MDQIEELREIIEKLRSRLHVTSHGKCFCDPEIVKVSQELNEVLNKYDNLIKNANESFRGDSFFCVTFSLEAHIMA